MTDLDEAKTEEKPESIAHTAESYDERCKLATINLSVCLSKNEARAVLDKYFDSVEPLPQMILHILSKLRTVK